MSSTKLATVPKIVRPPILPIFGRTLILFCSIALCMCITFTWWARGPAWIYDSESSDIVILQCPQYLYAFTGTLPLGPYCQVSLKRTQDTLDRLSVADMFKSHNGSQYHCVRPTNTEDPIVCFLDHSCSKSCSRMEDGGPCLDPSLIPDPPVGTEGPLCQVVTGRNPSTGETVYAYTDCKKLQIGSYCDSTFRVTPSNSLAMRGIVAGALLVALIWFVAEWVLRSVDIDLRHEKAEGMARMALELPEKRAILRQSLEQRWKQEMLDPAPSLGSSGDFSPHNFSTHSFVSCHQADPARRFSSARWRRRTSQWRQLREGKSKAFQAKEFFRTLLLNIFFLILLIGTFYLIILISPQNISLVETADDSLWGKVSVWKMTYWIDILIFIDLLLDFGLFLCAVIVVKWPKSPLFTQHIQDRIRNIEAEANDPGMIENSEDDTLSLSSLAGSSVSGDSGDSVSFVLNQAVSVDTCLMIACHLSTMTEARCATFSNTLRSALAVFPPSHIFVCDNGPTMEPADETQWIAKQVHPEINYLYVPEGNKTFAFYWCNKFWIPFLAKHGVVSNFTYTVIIDDDVPLPVDLHIPHEHLKKDPNIKAVHFPITAATPDGKFNMLVSCQDVEYKLAAVHKQLQAAMSRSLSCHGAIALWDRGAMAEVLQEHDTVFNGEDLYMGLCLLRKRDKSTIISCAQTIVPTYAPDHFRLLFRQRVKSWELTSHKKTFTFLIEIINPLSFCHFASICLKPYFIQELLTVLLDWLRIFLLAGLLLRDTLGLILMTIVFTFLLYFQLILFQFVILRDRRDLRSSFGTILTFPYYKLLNLLFRMCALCQNLLVYSHERKGMKISKREDEVRDIPPCPPHFLVDWFSIWSNTEGEEVARKTSRSNSRLGSRAGSRAGSPRTRLSIPI